MRQRKPALGHHLHEITKAEFVPQIPAHAEHDDLPVEMAAFEKIVNVQHAWPGSSRANLPPNMRHTHASHQNHQRLAGRPLWARRMRTLFGAEAAGLVRAAASHHPSGRGVTDADYTILVRWLASPEAEFIQGQVIFVNGGANLSA